MPMGRARPATPPIFATWAPQPTRHNAGIRACPSLGTIPPGPLTARWIGWPTGATGTSPFALGSVSLIRITPLTAPNRGHVCMILRTWTCRPIAAAT